VTEARRRRRAGDRTSSGRRMFTILLTEEEIRTVSGNTIRIVYLGQKNAVL
jgi:hypothetical protein